MGRTPEFERTLRRYVEGSLDDELRTELEELLVTDPDAFEALGVVEDEMIEAYLDADASAPEAASFAAEGFLASPERRRQLRLTRALVARAAAEAAGAVKDAPLRATARTPARAPTPSWFAALAGGLRPSRWATPAWVAAACALALSLTGNVWLASRRPVPPAFSPETTPALVLPSGLLRAAGTLPRLAVPAGAAVVRLVCELPGQDYPSYRAAVVDEDGAEIWAASRLRAEAFEGRSVVLLLVPAAVLSRGDYQVKLSGVTPRGEPEAVSSSPFRVTAP